MPWLCRSSRSSRSPRAFRPGAPRAARSAGARAVLLVLGALAALGATGQWPASAIDSAPDAAPPPETRLEADPAETRAAIDAAIDEAAARYDLPPAWIAAVMARESAFDPLAVSPKGAMGLMQIMPATWDLLRPSERLGGDPFDVRDNVLAGAAYLRAMHDRFGAPWFLAAYNAGPERARDHLATGRPLPAETRAYLAALAPVVGYGQAVTTKPTTIASPSAAPIGPKISVPDVEPLTPDAPDWRAAPLFVAVGPARAEVREPAPPIGPETPAQSPAQTAAAPREGARSDLFAALREGSGP